MTTWKEEIEDGPLATELAPFVAAGSDGQVAAILNDRTRGETRLQHRLLSARGMLADYAGGPVAAAVVLDKLEAASASVSAIKWVMTFLRADGIDIGHPATQGMLGQLAGNVLTVTEAANTKALGFVPASRAEIAMGREATIFDVSASLRNDDGTRK